MATHIMTASAGQPFSDFQFVAHDAQVRARGQIPTFVRAHVMERYHRERRAKKASNETHDSNRSQHSFLSQVPKPVGNGTILKWDDDDESGRKGRKTNTQDERRKAVTKKKVKKQGQEDSISQRCNGKAGTCEANDVIQRRDHAFHGSAGEVEDMKLRAMEEFWQRFERIGQQRSLMPKDELEQGGMSLVRILDSYYRVLDGNRESVDPWHTLMVPFGLSDRSLFHACASKFGMHAAASNGTTQASVEFLKHKGIALERLSSLLSDPSTEPTDQLIATSIFLVGTEMINSDHAAMVAHLKGARKMIQLRGGVRNMKTDPILIAGYLSYEYVIATFDGDLSDISALAALDVPHPHVLLFPARAGIFTLSRNEVDPIAYGYSQETVDLLTALCGHMCISDVFVSHKQSEDEANLSLAALMEELDRKQWARDFGAANARKDDKSTHQSLVPQEDHVLQAICITAALQFPHLAPPSRLGSTTQEQKVKQLKYHISSFSRHHYWTPIPGALLWCLMVGTTASKGMTERSFFIAHLLRATCGISVALVEPVRAALATFHLLAQQEKIARHEDSHDNLNEHVE